MRSQTWRPRNSDKNCGKMEFQRIYFSSGGNGGKLIASPAMARILLTPLNITSRGFSRITDDKSMQGLDPMPRGKERPAKGLKLEITVIPANCWDWTLADIARHLGNGPLLWPGGAGRSQGIKFVSYDIKKKRGRKPKVPRAADK
jgi:hypothetical protein